MTPTPMHKPLLLKAMLGVAASAALLLVGLPADATILSGTVHAEGAQAILAPQSMQSPVTLQFFVPDGTHVKAGEPVLRIDASSAAAQLQTLEDKITLTQATNAKDLTAAQLAVIDAKLALVQARATRDKAKVDAGIPKGLISALDFDTYQGAYKSAKRDTILKKHNLEAAEATVKRQTHDGDLQIRKLKLELAFFQGEVDSATVVAKHAGVVIHGFQHLWFAGTSPGRFREGSVAYPGTQVGQVIGTGTQHFSVQAWALQPDRRGLKVGQVVRVHFDALPETDVEGHIATISAAAEKRPEWGDGHYYRVDITLGPQADKLALLPGMSTRVQTDVQADRKPPATTRVSRQTLQATGQTFAQRSFSVVPPRIPGVWQLNITRMAPDGAHVKKGQALVTFAAGSLAQKLPAQLSTLAEKKRSRKQLRLQLADDKRTAELAVAKARGDAVKAKRKAQQPKQYVAAIDYQKLVIDRDSTRKILALTEQRAKISVASRKAQMDEANAKVTQAERTLERMRKSMASLTIRAPHDGLFLHRIKSDGSRIDTGDQVFFGMRVGSMPDMQSLAVHAALPERELRLVHIGQPVQVVLSGGASRTLDGKIASIGQNVHSKSDAQPIPVVQLLITLDEKPDNLKPGRSVSVDIAPTPKAAS